MPFRRFLASIVCLIGSTALAAEPDADILIRNGKVIDGSGNAWFHADIAITDGRIARVGNLKEIKASREVDATNLIVAPGFIDVHTHADNDLLKQPQAENFVRDGVTSIVTGNCGYGVADVREYFDKLRERGCALNVATLIGHNTVLRAVKGDKAGALTEEQLQKARGLVEQAMRDGAVGMSTGLIYTPGMYSPTDEIIELQKVAARFGGIYASHMRSESNEILDAIDEALLVGRSANCRVQISHFKLPRDVAARIGNDTTVKKILAAREAGQEVWVDQYPYTASSTTIRTLLPDWVSEQGDEEAKKILQDPQQLPRVLADMKQNNEVRRGRSDMSFAVISSSRAYPNLAGRNIKEIAQLLKYRAESGMPDQELLAEKPPALPGVSMEDQYRTVIDIYVKGGASCVFHTMDETEVETIMRCALVSVASDSGVREFGSGQPHPRGYGTNARVLGHYVRDRNVITLEEAIRKMTSMPATAFRFKDRGLVREGFAADLVIFDPNTVGDRATFEKPHAYAEGFAFVIVNGQIVVENDRVTAKFPGTPIYGPGRSE